MKKANKRQKNPMKDKIVAEDNPEKPKNIKEIEKELFSKAMTDYEVVSLGENRGQFFIRLPTRMTNKLEYKKGMKVKISMILNDVEKKIVLEAEK